MSYAAPARGRCVSHAEVKERMRGARTKFVEADMVNARGVDRVMPPGSRTAVEGVEDGPADLVREHP